MQPVGLSLGGQRVLLVSCGGVDLKTILSRRERRASVQRWVEPGSAPEGLQVGWVDRPRAFMDREVGDEVERLFALAEAAAVPAPDGAYADRLMWHYLVRRASPDVIRLVAEGHPLDWVLQYQESQWR